MTWRGLRRVVDALQRSLFDEEPSPAPVVTAPVPPAPPASGAPVMPVPAPVGEAPRRSRLDGREVAWTLRRARRRTIGFVVGEAGLVVTAPRWVTLRDVEAALQQKAGWVLRRLDDAQARAARQRAAQIAWADGVRVPYLGASLTVRLDPAARRGREAAVHVPGADGAGGELSLALPLDAAPGRIRDATQAWLQRQARAWFEERRRHFEPRLGVRATKLSLSSAATRWGSASSSGAIRLHWRLIHFDPQTIDYVVAHELAHLREMNHGERFWQAVGSVVGDVDAARRRLKTTELPPWT